MIRHATPHLPAHAPRCPRCAEALVLRRAQISPPSWGSLIITEWYTCGPCRQHYAYSPVEHRWTAAASV